MHYYQYIQNRTRRVGVEDGGGHPAVGIGGQAALGDLKVPVIEGRVSANGDV